MSDKRKFPTPQEQSAPTPKFLFDIPEAAESMCTTIFAIRQLCRSGMLRYAEIGHKFLISHDAIQDCIRLMEDRTKAKREARLARKRKLVADG